MAAVDPPLEVGGAVGGLGPHTLARDLPEPVNGAVDHGALDARVGTGQVPHVAGRVDDAALDVLGAHPLGKRTPGGVGR
ncbi:Uncharacterised protein [Mycobacteroides abscessus subsp. abscessus]|nr:Uncharacterised protein [Mycobacteroides abscessus subsp. abscessus]